MDIIDAGEARALKKRDIRQTTCEKFRYTVHNEDGKVYQVAPYFDQDGRFCAQHLRTPKKDFFWTGDKSDCQLFGQQLWREGGKRLVITEGEIDCMTVSQLQKNKWPVVSLPNGAQSAVKDIKRNLTWVESYEEVVLMFDMDEPGQEAARNVAMLLSPGKTKIASLPLKDANEMLLAKRGAEVVSALWEAKPYRPDGIVTLNDLVAEGFPEPEPGKPWPWDELTKLTYGRRSGEVYALGAGTGVGKTDVFLEIAEHTVTVLKERVGLIYLEQPVKETSLRLAGKRAKKRFHIPDAGWTLDELNNAFKQLTADEYVHLFKHFGVMDWPTIKAQIRFMVVSSGVKHIFLDHLTALATGGDRDEKTELEHIMAELAALAQELDFTLYFISHLATPDGKPHEEGGRVMVRHFKGSRSIGFWSHFMFGLERDQQAEDLDERRTTTFRVLKDRYTGQSTGEYFYLTYDNETGMLNSEADCPFGDGEPDDDDDIPF